jgi:hypothetical protein
MAMLFLKQFVRRTCLYLAFPLLTQYLSFSAPAIDLNLIYLFSIRSGPYAAVDRFGNYIFLLSETNGWHCVDISNPHNPRLAYSRTTTTDKSIQDLRVSSSSLLLCSDSIVFNYELSDPLNPRLLNSASEFGYHSLRSPVLLENHIFGASGGNVLLQFSPLQLGGWFLANTYTFPDVFGRPSRVEDVIAQGTNLFVAGGSAGFHICTISNGSLILQTGPLGSEIYSLGASENLVFAASRNRLLEIYDISAPWSAKKLSSFPLQGTPVKVKILDSFAYVLTGEAGLQIIDVSDPSQPRRAGFYTTIEPPIDIVADQNHVYLLTPNYGLFILEKTFREVEPLSAQISSSNVVVRSGSSVELSVSVQNHTDPVSYQWYRGASPIPGAIADRLLLSDLHRTNTASYNVMVANSLEYSRPSCFVRVVGEIVMESRLEQTNRFNVVLSDSTSAVPSSVIPYLTIQSSTHLHEWITFQASIATTNNGDLFFKDTTFPKIKSRYFRVIERFE